LSALTFFFGIALFDVLDFIDDDKIDLVIGEDVADKLDCFNPYRTKFIM
jgi:hypothetical protein